MESIIQMLDGQYIDLLKPDFSKTKIDSIGWALSNICRFNGHTKQFYSVAQHSVLSSFLVPEHLAYDALMHDSAEAIIGDVASPLKRLLPDYKAIEETIEIALFKTFNVKYPLPPEIKTADLMMLKAERELLMPDTGDEWEVLKDVQVNSILRVSEVWDQKRSYERFINRFKELER
tara:strand:- start:85 stop:612 length:528 start_codon:yes stop_codon:yes gene_type:complete